MGKLEKHAVAERRCKLDMLTHCLFQLLMVVSAAQHHAAFSVEHKIKLGNIRTYLETLSSHPVASIEKQVD